MNPTVAGLLSVVIWGIAIAFIRLVEEQIGPVAYAGTICAGTALLGFANHLAQRRPLLPHKDVFRHPAFYGRWIFFVMNQVMLVTGVSLVQKQHVPFVVLINYLWPTAVIICSIWLAGVKITRWWAFILGSVIVIVSMAIELVGPHGISYDLFSTPRDCLAYLIIFIGAVSWGVYSALSRRADEAAGGGTVIPLFQSTVGLLLPLSFLPGMATWSHLEPSGFFILAGYCVLQFLAYLCWDLGMRRGNIVILSLCADFIPWLSLVATHFILDVDIGGKTIISAVMLVGGATITRYGTLQKKFVIGKYELPET